MYFIEIIIKRWSKSQAKSSSEKASETTIFDKNESIELIMDETDIRIQKAQQTETLPDLFRSYHGDYKPHEWETGAPVGKEKF